MKRILSIVLNLMLATMMLANDGVYLTSGSNIYPVLETDISIDKEYLSFIVIDGVAHVSIEFHFLNNSDQQKSIQVGFQAPSSSGDVSDELSSRSQIRDFKIQLNESVLPYQLYAAECEDCELMDVSKANFTQSMDGVFVYLFDATFEPGINKVNHSYSFPASSNVSVEEIYDYILTTGSKWASGSIREFELSIDMGANSYFYVSDIFGQQANWSIQGTGKVTDIVVSEFGSLDNRKMVRTLNGSLKIQAKDFSPKNNLEFGVLSRSSFSTWGTDNGETREVVLRALMYFSLDSHVTNTEELTREELRIIRNTIFAQKGYFFKDETLKEYFSEFAWCIPDPNLHQEDIVLTTREREFVEQIRQREKTTDKNR